jgi:hypothetical protein
MRDSARRRAGSARTQFVAPEAWREKGGLRAVKLPLCSDSISREIEARAINLKARGARPVELRKRTSGVWCSEWERQGEYRTRPRWLSLYTKDEGIARQRFEALKAEVSCAVGPED